MNELIAELARTVVELEQDIHAQGYDHGWAFWTVCPDADHAGFHLHKQGGHEYRHEDVQIFTDYVAKQPFPTGLIGMILSYEVTAPTVSGVADGRVVLCSLRDGYMLMLSRIADGKPRLEFVAPQRAFSGPGAPVAINLRTHVTNPAVELPDMIRNLLDHLPPGTQAFLINPEDLGL